jgi:DeoR/GlpR family transcriptional regulator of sugar metabolism
MIEQRRRSDILERVRKDEFVSVEELSRELGVSLMTIRRDLSWLSEKGLVERCHGGAALKKEIPFREKQITNASVKERIAAKAEELIEKNDTVFLDAGTTTYQIAKKIMNRPDLTVVTIDVEIAYLLRESAVSLMVCGGEVQHQTGSVLGYFTNAMIRQLNFNVAFLGTPCIDADFYTSTPTVSKVELKNTVLANSSRTYLVADSSKFGTIASVKVNSLSEYTGVISDIKPTDEQLGRLKTMKINLISVS